MWVHGGSFIAGSATAPGLDGSKLAVATNSIVAVMQYRLGALGFMSNGATNLAVKDTINAMNFLAKVVPSFGGSASKITLAGQSSGAGMIRAILATPSASSLFQSAILQSDPIVRLLALNLLQLLILSRPELRVPEHFDSGRAPECLQHSHWLRGHRQGMPGWSLARLYPRCAGDPW
jgi:hypothetical protein